MSRAMHEEALVSLIADQRVERPLEQAAAHQSLGHCTHRGIVRLVPVVAGPDLGKSRLLRLEHDTIDLALRRAEAAVDR